MAKFYLQKIINKDLNELTGEAWKLEDVPVLWKSEVSALLEIDSD